MRLQGMLVSPQAPEVAWANQGNKWREMPWEVSLFSPSGLAFASSGTVSTRLGNARDERWDNE